MIFRSVVVFLFSISTIHIQAFGPEQVGPCRGPGGANDKVNSRSAVESTQAECQQACVDLPDCIGYAYCASCNQGECILYGPGVDGTCSDPSALNEPACEAIGTCSNSNQLTEDTCGVCSGSALSKTTCTVVGGTWTPNVWTSSNEVWTDAEDPWTGESHHSTVITGTTGEATSNYVCVDANPEDHMAHCHGDGVTCTTAFNGLVESDRTDEKCPEQCTFKPKPTPPKNKPPHPGDIGLPGWDAAMSGACRGGPDYSGKINGKYSNTVGSGEGGKLTQEECAAACLNEPECVGYAHSTAWCVVYGPNIHITPGDGWTSDNHPTTIITGTKPNDSYICVTGPPHPKNNPPTNIDTDGSGDNEDTSGAERDDLFFAAGLTASISVIVAMI